jgi:hypothetical protein
MKGHGDRANDNKVRRAKEGFETEKDGCADDCFDAAVFSV